MSNIETFDDILALEETYLEIEETQKQLAEETKIETKSVHDWSSWCKALCS